MAKRSIVPLALLFFTVLALVLNWPIFLGKIPLPAGLVTFYPPWEHLHSSPPSWPRIAELSDLVTAFYPWRAFTAAGFNAGEAPLWNPLVLGGTPFLGATQSALFYPLTRLYAVFQTNVAWTLNILLRTALAGFFTALFASRLGMNTTGAIGAGAIYVLGGSFVIWQGQALGDAWVWLPAVLLATEALYAKPSGRRAGFLAIAFALPLLAGHPETAFHIAAFAVIFAAFRIASLETRHTIRFIVLFAAGGALGVGLAAAQILPTLEWLTQIDPELGALYPGRPPSEILALVSRDLRSNPNSAGIFIPEGAAYAGLMALALAGFAFFQTKRRMAWFWLIVAVLGLQIAYGFGPADWVVDHIPIVQALKNNRVLFIVNFAIAILAGLGISFLQEDTPRASRFRQWAVLGGAFGVLTIAILILRSYTVHHVPDWDNTPRFTLLLLALATAIIAFHLFRPFKAKTFSIVVLGFIVAEMGTAAFGVVPFARPAEVFPRAPVFDFLAGREQPFRITGVDFPYLPNVEIMYGISSISGYEIWSKRTAKLMGSFRMPGVVGLAASAEGIVQTNNRVLDLLNVRYVIATTSEATRQISLRPDRFRVVFSDRSTQVFENTTTLPRAFAVPAGCVTVAATDEEQLARVTEPSFDPLRRVVLPAATGMVCDEAAVNPPEFRVSSPNRTEMEVNADRDAIVVWSEMHYPGWRVFLDGQERELLRANYNLMAVAVPPGKHGIRFVFDPESLRRGKWISLVAMLLAASAIVLMPHRSNS